MKTLLLPILLLLFVQAADVPPAQRFVYQHEGVLGTSLELKVTALSENLADAAEQLALTEIDRLNAILSSYDPQSEFRRWQTTKQTDVKVSAELFEVLRLFDQWQVRTGGALNASAGVAAQLWQQSARSNTLPSEEQLTHAVRDMQQPHWQLDEVQHTARHLSDAPLLFNTFVKSYIIQRVADRIMAVPGVTGAVVNIGGDMVVTGAPGERVSVVDPAASSDNSVPVSLLNVSRKAIATSGNYRRGYTVAGQWYSHIIDARTALPANGIRSATVLADAATDAGALATAFNILTPGQSMALAQQVPGVEYQLITSTGAIIESDGWKNFETPAPQISKSADGYELSVELELARFEGRFRRPFVAVWLENKKKESVRTLAVWYNKPRWLPDLKRWYSKNQEYTRDYATMTSISSATRSAGKYTLTWDGLDDKGESLPNGKYTLYIEAAREHGTYQLIKQEIEWNSKEKHIDLEGGVEITSAAVDLHALPTN